MTDHNPADPSAPVPPQGNPYAVEQPPAKKKSPVLKIILIVVGLVVALCVAGVVAAVFLGDSVTTAKVGDCITETVEADASDAKVVDCGDAKAANKVVGIEEGKSRSAATIGASTGETCKGFPTAANFIWVGENTSSGDVWCLEPLSK